MRFQLSIDGTPLDLFEDEPMVLSRQLKDLQSIDKVVSDYSQSFSVPATTRNNKVFKHWYNPDVLNGFNAHTKVDASIEVDGLEVFRGVVELRNVAFEGYAPTKYEIVFYGEAKKLSTALGDKMLSDIDWSDYNHTRSVAKVTNSWSGTLLSGKILYPVVGLQDAFSYNDASGSTLPNNLGKTPGISNTDLRPSILLTEMVKHVIQEQGYTTQGGFYTDTYFDDLYVLPSAYAGKLNRVNVTPVVKATRFSQSALGTANTYKAFSQWVETKDNTNSFNFTSGVFTVPTAGDYDLRTKTNIAVLNSGASLDVTLFKNNTALTGVNTTNYLSTGSKTATYSLTSLAVGDELEVRYRSTDSGAQVKDLEFEVTSGPSTVSDLNVNMAEVMPKMKASTFIKGVMSTFNLVLVPVSETRIDVEPYQSWLEDGATKNFTQFVDISQVTHDKIEVPNSISFKHKESTDFVNQAFSKNNGRQFGALFTEPSVDFGEGAIDVKSPFTIFPQAYLKKMNNNGGFISNTNIQFYHALDGTNNPLGTELLLFYYNGLKSSNTWYFASSSKTTFPVISPFSAEPTVSGTNSLAFSLESALNGDTPTNTLFSKFWNSYISRIYSSQSRKVTLKMYLPVGEWLNLEFNDTINISGYYYKIDSIKYNLLSQEAQMVLLTYPNVNVTEIASSSGNTVTVTPAAQNDAGQTFVGTGGQSDVINNIVRVNDEASTDAPNQQNVNLVQQFTVITNSFSDQDLGGGGNDPT